MGFCVSRSMPASIQVAGIQYDLYAALSGGDLSYISKLVHAGVPSNFTLKDFGNQSLLHVAAGRGFTEICRFLLASGAEVDARDSAGNTPLFYAVKQNHLHLFSLLKGYGADFNATSNYGKSIEDYIAPTGNFTKQDVLDKLSRLGYMEKGVRRRLSFFEDDETTQSSE